MQKTPYEKRMFNRGYKDGINGKPKRYHGDAYSQGHAKGAWELTSRKIRLSCGT